MKNRINYFAEEANQNTKPKHPENKDVAYENKPTVDPEVKVARRKTLIRWLVSLSIIGALIGLLVWSCMPAYKTINPTTAEIQDKSLVVKSSEGSAIQNYTISLTNKDAKSYFVATPGEPGNTYSIIIKAKNNNAEVTIQLNVMIHFTNGKIDILNIGSTSLSKKDTSAWTEELWSWGQNIGNKATVMPQTTSVWYIIVQLLPTLLIVGMLIWYMSKLGKMGGMGSGEESIFGMGKTQAKIATSTVKFTDVAGIEEEKQELIEIVDYLKNPEKYAVMGARTPRGVLLYGPPGTGKTLLAKAVAGEAKVPFFQASGSGFEDMLVGVGAKRVRDLFTKAKKSAPSIIFIDEIDSVAGKRGRNDIAGGSGGIADQTINQLLAEMDGFNTRTGVVIMAATNRLGSLDEAILRPGRFDRQIQVNLPDIKEREAILKIHARNKNLSSKVVLNDVARRTPGFSGAQLENVLNEATLLAVRLNKTSIGINEIDEAIDRVLAGPAKKTRVITDGEKRQIAFHEAGHALVGLHTKGGDVVEKITIIPRGMTAGYTLSAPERQELSIQRKSDLLGIIRTTLGGRAAEFVEYGADAISTGASNDLYKITNIVRSMVTQLGMSSVGMTQFIPSEGQQSPFSSKLFSDETSLKIDHEIEKIIQAEYQNVIDIIKKNKKELDLIVETLLILETIVKKQIDYIHDKLQLPEEAIARKAELAQSKKLAAEERVATEKVTETKVQPAKVKKTVASKTK